MTSATSDDLRRLADVDRLVISDTRLRGVKRVVVRVLRVFSSQQAAFNRAVVERLGELDPRSSRADDDDVVAELRARIAWLDRTVVEIHGPMLTEVRSELVRLTDAVSELTWLLDRVDRSVEAPDIASG